MVVKLGIYTNTYTVIIIRVYNLKTVLNLKYTNKQTTRGCNYCLQIMWNIHFNLNISK